MKRWIAGAVGLALGVAAGAELLENEREIPLDEVPVHVLDAAREAVPGIVITEADIESEDPLVPGSP